MGYKDGLQPETLADGNWLVKQNQPVSKIETKSDTNIVFFLHWVIRKRRSFQLALSPFKS
jgi:hypothetical protein